MLQAASINPLIALMRENDIERLEFPERNWFLDINGTFSNPLSIETKQGNIEELSNQGSVFTRQNSIINPYLEWGSLPPRDAAVQEAEEMTFKEERWLQAALRQNIAQLEPGLKVIDGGSEQAVEGGRIDITAEDQDNIVVVIELKVGVAKIGIIGQTLAYMACLSGKPHTTVRGILVAQDFHLQVQQAAKLLPNLKLKRYSVKFSFQDV